MLTTLNSGEIEGDDRKRRWRGKEKLEERISKSPRFMLEENPLEPEDGWTVEKERSCIVVAREEKDDHLNKSGQEMSTDKERSPTIDDAVKKERDGEEGTDVFPYSRRGKDHLAGEATSIFFEIKEIEMSGEEYVDKQFEDLLVHSFSCFAIKKKPKEERPAMREKARDILRFLAKKLNDFIKYGISEKSVAHVKLFNEMKKNLIEQPAYVGRVLYILESEYKTEEDKNVLLEALLDAAGIDLTLGSEMDRKEAIKTRFDFNTRNDDIHLVCDNLVRLATRLRRRQARYPTF